MLAHIDNINAEIATMGRKVIARHLMADRVLCEGTFLARYRGTKADYLRRDAMRRDLLPVARAYNAWVNTQIGAALDRLNACEQALAEIDGPDLDTDNWLDALVAWDDSAEEAARADIVDAEQALDAMIARWERVAGQFNAIASEYNALERRLMAANAKERRAYAEHNAVDAF